MTLGPFDSACSGCSFALTFDESQKSGTKGWDRISRWDSRAVSKFHVRLGRSRLLVGALGLATPLPGSWSERWVEGEGCLGGRESPQAPKWMMPFGLALEEKPRHRAADVRRIQKVDQ